MDGRVRASLRTDDCQQRVQLATRTESPCLEDLKVLTSYVRIQSSHLRLSSSAKTGRNGSTCYPRVSTSQHSYCWTIEQILCFENRVSNTCTIPKRTTMVNASGGFRLFLEVILSSFALNPMPPCDEVEIRPQRR